MDARAQLHVLFCIISFLAFRESLLGRGGPLVGTGLTHLSVCMCSRFAVSVVHY